MGAADDPTAKGTAIGKIVSGAIDTALPGISKLASGILAIFAPQSATSKPKDDTQKSQTQQTQTQQLQKKLDDAATSLTKQIQANVAGVEPLAIQLGVLGPFLQYGFRASNDLASLMAYVTAHPHPTGAQWDKIAADWSEIKGALSQLTDTDFSKVKSDELRTLLAQVVEAKNTTAKAIQVYVDSGRPSSSDADPPCANVT
jgi:hypothetical protein